MPTRSAESPNPVFASPVGEWRAGALDTLLAILKTPGLAARIGAQAELWPEVKRLAEIHRFSGLLAHSTSAWLPATERPWRDQTLMRHYRLHVQRLEALRILGEAFRAEGIDVVSLKGPLLAERFYSMPFLRPSNDLDLLIRKNDVGRTARLMRKLGFRLTDPYPWNLQQRLIHHMTFGATDFSPRIEMHYELRAGWRAFGADAFLDRSVLWRSAAGFEFPVLSMADEAFYSCVHAAAHAFHRLRWLYDAITIAQKLMPAERADVKVLAIRHDQTGHFIAAALAGREFFGEAPDFDCSGFRGPRLWGQLTGADTRRMAERVEGISASIPEKIGVRLDLLRMAGSPWKAARFLAWQLNIEIRKRWYDLSHPADPEALLKTLPL